MKLKNLIEQLQSLVNDQPKLAEYTVKFREEVGKMENVTHYHTEGRVLILSDVWASDTLNPTYGKLEDQVKFKDKLRAFLTDAEMAAKQVVDSPKPEGEAK